MNNVFGMCCIQCWRYYCSWIKRSQLQLLMNNDATWVPQVLCLSATWEGWNKIHQWAFLCCASTTVTWSQFVWDVRLKTKLLSSAHFESFEINTLSEIQYWLAGIEHEHEYHKHKMCSTVTKYLKSINKNSFLLWLETSHYNREQRHKTKRRC